MIIQRVFSQKVYKTIKCGEIRALKQLHDLDTQMKSEIMILSFYIGIHDRNILSHICYIVITNEEKSEHQAILESCHTGRDQNGIKTPNKTTVTKIPAQQQKVQIAFQRKATTQTTKSSQSTKRSPKQTPLARKSQQRVCEEV
ncbi:Hypothetical_protein [Hexamita inflata]|uniref:Hypothetical_protein n=1 Tax=Hexamita inflata TaxID=28002 RepID=A0AA86TUA5_9EUKA|nr:Hypothetical protein HINF_LOCUS14957 [Hexamita inflata]